MVEIIRRYEIGGSQYFIERGFKLGAAFPIDKLIKEEYQSFLEKISAARKNPGEFPHKLSTTYNSLHYRWKTLAESGCPYVKRELLAHNPAEVEISDWPVTLEEHTDFPVEFIIQSICNHLSSDDFIYTTINKLKLAQLLNISGQVTLPISPAFSKFAKHFSWEPSRTFLFDEDYYLRKYPDVDHVIKLNGMKSAVYHFLMYGYSENRSVRLIRTYNQANTTQPNNKEI